MTEELETITLCLHQVFRPKEPSPIKLDGVGDCYSCTYDEKNKQCKRYYGIRISTYDCKGQDR